MDGIADSIASGQANGLSLGPVSGPQSRTGDLVRMLSEDIRSGRLTPGQRLPTEQEMVRLTGVSRTVVREAVAALRAEGLVTTRQGVGAFVATMPGGGTFRIAPEEAASVERVLQILELRLGLEVEAAGLAARRGNAPAIEILAERQAEFRVGADLGDIVIGADYAFHKALAEATGNPYFARILDSLGQIVIPRQSFASTLTTRDERRDYLGRIADEHDAILNAIRAGDAAAARAAMRHHLTTSSDRYRSYTPLA